MHFVQSKSMICRFSEIHAFNSKNTIDKEQEEEKTGFSYTPAKGGFYDEKSEQKI